MQISVTSVNCAVDQCRSCGSQIIINNYNYSPKRDGINVAVYNPKRSEVVISASFQNPSSILFEKFVNSIKDGHVIIVTSQLICSNDRVTNLRIQKNVINAFRNWVFHQLYYRSNFDRELWYTAKTNAYQNFPSISSYLTLRWNQQMKIRL